jgi:hypothetical protein
VRREINNRDKLFFPEHTFSAEYAGRIKGEAFASGEVRTEIGNGVFQRDFTDILLK